MLHWWDEFSAPGPHLAVVAQLLLTDGGDIPSGM